MKIKGKLCNLRTLKLEDAKSLSRYGNNKAVTKWTTVPYPYTLKDAKKFILTTQKNQKEKKSYNLGIEVEGKIVGMMSLMDIDYKNKNAEIGYWLGKDYWRRGIVSEALNLILGFGFDKLKLIKVWAGVHHPNIASFRLLEKAGFVREGIFRKHEYKNNRWVNHFYYGILKKEYKAKAKKTS